MPENEVPKNGELQRRERLRSLPAVDSVLRAEAASEPVERHGRTALASAVREVLDGARAEILAGSMPPVSEEEIARSADGLLERRGLRRVVNATGVILHTNLGRSVLSDRAVDAVVSAASGYSNLEYDLGSGGRGSRYDHAVPLLRQLTGAEDALVVNNCAAATLLALSAVVGTDAGSDSGAPPEVVVSRGQLIEIGGGFRIPEVLELSGARLREVGTTNRTRLADYERAIGENTRAILWVHPSNFETVGFTESVGVSELATLGPPVISDVGSGAMLPVADEPRVTGSVRDGAALTIFSGDKLLGGPQAGITVGEERWVRAMRENPLARAVRADKLCLAALEATLDAYLRGPEAAREELPTQRMIHANAADVEDRARALAHRIREAVPELEADVADSTARSGGGTLPIHEIPSHAVRVSLPGSEPEELASRLRSCPTPVVGRVYEGRLWLDARTLLEGDEERIAEALVSVVG
ncbi:L-seryl-tRNA(Sec) selenium transferase [soil metagenome]